MTSLLLIDSIFSSAVYKADNYRSQNLQKQDFHGSGSENRSNSRHSQPP